jgi:DNA processing protein
VSPTAASRRDLAGWLRLISIAGIGGGAQRALLKSFGLPESIFAQPRPALVPVIGERATDLLLAADASILVDAALSWLDADERHRIVTLGDAAYPPSLLELPDPPTVLFGRGNVELLMQTGLAIVGSRNATAGGIRNAEQFGRAIGGTGVPVISGLALGIDAAAHRGALDGGGTTIAVVGTGIDRIYPARNADLARRIADEGRGLILSELPLGAGPLAHHFPRRNRIIAGLSRGVLVVEAATESGSLITARLAAEQGREVFAIPGSIHSPQSRGCHRLIRQGAKLVESAADILEEFSGLPLARGLPVAGSDAAGHELVRFLGHDPVTIDELAARSGLTAEALLAILFELELGGVIATLPGGRYQRLQ